MTKRVRITGGGIYGTPTKDNPSGEMPIGFEFDISGDLPAGWKGRAEIVGAEPEKGSVLIGNADDDERITAAREEVRTEAQKFIDGLRDEHAAAIKTLVELKDAADARVAELQARVAELEAEAATRGPDADLIRAAIEGLDPKNDAHWTKAGLPEVAAVKEALGADVSRAHIDAAAPDAKRPAAE